MTRPDQAGGADAWDQRIHSGERRRAVEKDHGVSDQAKPQRREDGLPRGGNNEVPLGKDDQRADRELVGAIDRQIERAGGIGREPRLCGEQRGGADQQNEHRQGLAQEPPADQQDGGPRQIELFFYRQRPEMQNRARIDRLGKIVVAAAPEIEVGDRAECGDDVLGEALEVFRRKPQGADHERADDGHEGGGKQSPDPSFVKARQREVPALCVGQDVS